MSEERPPNLNPPPEDPAAEQVRRAGWTAYRHAHPWFIGIMAAAIVLLLAADGWIIAQRRYYRGEIARLRESMTEIERQRADEIVASEESKLRIAIELLRRQSQIEQALHLSVTVDSNAMLLEREGALLRQMPVQIGPERRVGVPPDTVQLATPRGVRTIARVLTAADRWEVPEWVYLDRGVAVDSNRVVTGALGPIAIVLDGGTLIYSLPKTGPLSDSNYVLPGAVRAREGDLRAILPNLSAGIRVYFY